MKHKQIQTQLSAYLDDQLSQQELKQVETHLRTCNECAEILSDLSRNVRWMVDLRQPAPSGIWEGIHTQIATESQDERKRDWYRSVFRPIPVGAMALATCLLLALVYLRPSPQPVENPLDIYLTAHTEYTVDNLLPSDSFLDPFATEEEPAVTSTTPLFSDDTDTSLDAYLDAYLGDETE